MATGTACGAVWFAVFVLAHAGVSRYGRITRRSHATVTLFAGTIVGCIVTFLAAPRHSPFLIPPGGVALGIAGGTLVMLTCFILYMPFYYTIATSLSVHTLVALERAPRHELSLADLWSRFAAMRLLNGRLEAMVHSGLLFRHPDGYRLTPRGQRSRGCSTPLRSSGGSARAVEPVWRLRF